MMGNNIFTILLLFIFLTALNSTYAQSEKPQDLVVKFLDIVKRDAYMSPTINWDSVRPAFIEETKNIQDLADLQPYFKKFIRSLGDRHSEMIYSATGEQEESEMDVMEKYAHYTYAQVGQPLPNFNHYLIDNKYAYINIPSVVIEQRNYIDTIGNQLLELDKQNPKAWIIDLTENGGGSIYPMLWQFASLIDNMETYSDIDNKGNETKQRKIFDVIEEEDKRYFELMNFDYEKVRPVELINVDVPIVVLTSGTTGSAAEFFAVAFKGQKNVRLIGQTTAGATSGNSDYLLNKNYMLNLTTSVIKDRTGKVYKIGEGIDPDIYFELEEGLVSKDETEPEVKQKYLEAAIKFLEGI